MEPLRRWCYEARDAGQKLAGACRNTPDRASMEEAMATTDQPPETLSEVQHRERETVDGGELVYDVETEHRSHLDREVSVSRRLVGFANITDWDGIRSALIKRGHGVGALHHLPVLESDR